MLTLQFWLSTEEAKQKSLYRSDAQQLMPLGTNLAGELPPGFCTKPSQSRPGQQVFQDLTTGMKYQTLELAWQTYFQRLLERPVTGGIETIAHLPGSQAQGKQNLPHAPSNSSIVVQHRQLEGAAAGLVTEYETEAAAPSAKQAAFAAEGLVTEHKANRRPHNQLATASAPPPQQVPQQLNGGQRQGAQLAAELLGMRQAPAPAPYGDRSARRPEGPVVNCRNAGMAPYAAGPAGAASISRAPVAVP